ncbi:MAG: M67 family metallopeptidase [Methanosarcinales archaeon]|nr:M67 family metallopeptidase [ANME-2 cluster archaeon]MDF1531961.1 M67 family metallopeptidase [ANME-2 cluster archaeon]MDW7775439.1 M67 family metallopeptidase [Methanosarcinales archaeon]
MTDVQFRNDHFRLLDDELALHAPYEACGILIGRKEQSSIIVEIVVPIKNSRPSDRSFELDPREHYDAWNRAEEEGMEIVGVYHTHPHSKASPSAWDRESMENYQTLWVIVGIDGIHGFEWDAGIKPVEVIEIS